MKKIFATLRLGLIIVSGTVLLSSCHTEGSDKNAIKAQSNNLLTQNPDAGQIIQNWPEVSRSVANKMIEKYGQPTESTPERLIWNQCPPWKRTTVYKEEVLHRFPEPHASVLEQTIDYQVMIDAYNAIASFNGSVLIDRTKGELSSRSDMEAMNFLAINIAHEIEQDTMSIPLARKLMYIERFNFIGEQVSEYTRGFNFELPQGDQTDPDISMVIQFN
jgi:hypothetical protein